eukprot:363256-Chlamydomonas_euryale.AAC.12
MYARCVTRNPDSPQLVAPPTPPAPPEPPVTAKGVKVTPLSPPPVDASPPEPDEPVTHWSLEYSEEFAPAAGPHTKPASPKHASWKSGDVSTAIEFHFEYGAPCAFRHDAGHAALEELVNRDVLLRLHDSGSGAVLATLPLDMLPFALGQQTFDVDDVELAPYPSPPAGTKVCEV